jgi:hypothetical protein
MPANVRKQAWGRRFVAKHLTEQPRDSGLGQAGALRPALMRVAFFRMNCFNAFSVMGFIGGVLLKLETMFKGV